MIRLALIVFLLAVNLAYAQSFPQPTIGGGVAIITAGTGISVSPTTGVGRVTITNTGVTSITGTTNQITASSPTGAVTLSLPTLVNLTSTGKYALGLTTNDFLLKQATYNGIPYLAVRQGDDLDTQGIAARYIALDNGVATSGLSTGGIFRVTNNSFMYWRNAANNANVQTFGVNTSDQAQINAPLLLVTSMACCVASPTAITNLRVYTPSLTPAATAAAIGASTQTFTVTGLTTADTVFVNGPPSTALCPLTGHARVSAADTIELEWVDLTVALCTPAAGTYTIFAIRS